LLIPNECIEHALLRLNIYLALSYQSRNLVLTRNHYFRLLLLFHAFLAISVEMNGQCSSVISTFPYSEDFESGPGGWFSGGQNDDWAIGTPQKPIINSAGSGTQAWITGGLIAPFYNYGERSWVQSPCFDFSSLNFPVVSFKIFWELENQYDGGNLQYSTDGGNNWQTLGNSNEPDNCVNQNWYTIRNVTNLSGFATPNTGWSGTIQSSSGSCRGGNGIGQWKDAVHCVSSLSGMPSVIFRFTMGSGTTCNDYDGMAFDLFRIYEMTPLPNTVSYACLGLNQIQFNDDNVNCHTNWLWNFGDQNSSENASLNANPIHTYNSPGIYTITLDAGSVCIPSSQASITVEILSIVSEILPVTCNAGSDGSINIEVINPPAGTTYEWNTNPVQTGSSIQFITAGDYSVLISSPGYCDQRLDLQVGYGPDAFPQVNLGPDTVVCPGIPIKISAGKYSSYTWQDGSTDSIYQSYNGGIVAILISNSKGCEATDTMLIEEDCLGDILFPNSFSPNEDGLNELFLGTGNLISSFDLTIYNRWGQLMFSSNNIMVGWDGKVNGNPQAEGIYTFKAKYSLRTADMKEKYGKISLIR